MELNGKSYWDFLGSPMVKTVLPVHAAQVRSLVGELSPHSAWGGQVKKKKKSYEFLKQNWDFKDISHVQ